MGRKEGYIMRIVADVLMDKYIVVEVWKDEMLLGGWYKKPIFSLSLNDLQEMCDTILEVIEYAEQAL